MVDMAALNDLVHLDRFHMHFHLARFDLAEFQQAVDLIEQALGVMKKILEISLCNCGIWPSVARKTKRA